MTRHQARMVGGISMLFAFVLLLVFLAEKATRGRDANGWRTQGAVTRWVLDSLGFEIRKPESPPDNSWSDYLGR